MKKYALLVYLSTYLSIYLFIYTYYNILHCTALRCGSNSLERSAVSTALPDHLTNCCMDTLVICVYMSNGDSDSDSDSN